MGREGGADLLSGCFWFPDQQWLLREETWLASLQQQQQQNRAAEKELEVSVTTDAWLQTDPETQPSPLVRSQKRVVRLQLLRRRALWAAERNIRQKRVSFQRERIIKKQRLLEAQKRLEQLKALCWLQDDLPQKPPHQVLSPDAVVPGSQCRSESTSCSSLSLQRLCLRYLPQLHRYSQSLSPRSIGCDLQPHCPGSVLYFLMPQFPQSVQWKDVFTPLPRHLFPLLTPFLSL